MLLEGHRCHCRQRKDIYLKLKTLSCKIEIEDFMKIFHQLPNFDPMYVAKQIVICVQFLVKITQMANIQLFTYQNKNTINCI